MIISITGTPGSGKSTAGKALSERLGIKHYSTGDLWREVGLQRGIEVYELNKLAESDPSIDQKIDNMTVELGKREDCFVIDSRIAWHFLPQSLKVKLIADINEAARRIFEHSKEGSRINEQKYFSIAEVAEAMQRRYESERQRFIELYGADMDNPTNFDLIIDTTHISPEETLEKIIQLKTCMKTD